MESIWIIYDISAFINTDPYSCLKALPQNVSLRQALSRETKREIPEFSQSLNAKQLSEFKRRVLSIVKAPNYSEDPLREAQEKRPTETPNPRLRELNHCVAMAIEMDKAFHGDLFIIAAQSEKIKYEINANKLNSHNIYYASNNEEMSERLNATIVKYHEDGGTEKIELTQGRYNGSQTLYNQLGKLTRKTTWHHGMRHSVVEYDNEGLPHGQALEFFPSANSVREETIWEHGVRLKSFHFNRKGQKHGLEIYFSRAGFRLTQ